MDSSPLRITEISSLEKLPTEIWAAIFKQACTDDGTTGRSLSLVSQYVSRVSRATKYNSIAIRGHPQIQRFHVFLSSRTEDDIPKVRHLMIHQRKVTQPPKDVALENLDGEAIVNALFSYEMDKATTKRLVRIILGQEIYHKYETLSPERVQGGRQYKLPHEILSILAPHLISFTCISSHALWPGIKLTLGDIHFPLLTELTLYATRSDIFGPDRREDPPNPNRPPSFPSLKYLHCAFCSSNISFIPHRIPALTHLRVTGGVIPALGQLHPDSNRDMATLIDIHPAPQLQHIGILPGVMYPLDILVWIPPFPKELGDMIEILESPRWPALRGSTSAAPVYPDESGIYGFAEVEEDWIRGVEGVGPYWTPGASVSESLSSARTVLGIHQ